MAFTLLTKLDKTLNAPLTASLAVAEETTRLIPLVGKTDSWHFQLRALLTVSLGFSPIIFLNFITGGVYSAVTLLPGFINDTHDDLIEAKKWVDTRINRSEEPRPASIPTTTPSPGTTAALSAGRISFFTRVKNSFARHTSSPSSLMKMTARPR